MKPTSLTLRRASGQQGHPASLTDHLVNSVVRLINQEALEPGDKLPAIKSMAERFAVATPTMREAIRRLEVVGLVEILHGSGVYVRETNMRVVFGNAGIGHIDPAMSLDVLDARLAIEPLMAARAAEKVTAADARLLRAFVDMARESLTDDFVLHDQNMRFHCAIAQMAGNSILHQTLQSYVDIYKNEQLFVLSMYTLQERPENNREHHDICEAIVDGNSQLAFDLMTRHLKDALIKTQEKLQQNQTMEHGQ
ncbi:FadR/GntR family transcriptional regulator [Pelagibacterium sp.]|uniref:FadR/GntR family transcriptional regulator n=1 Tax=Pelagibacterium sp. TaxID=1967288 RepID=UPI003C7C4A23